MHLNFLQYIILLFSFVPHLQSLNYLATEDNANTAINNITVPIYIAIPIGVPALTVYPMPNLFSHLL